MITPKKVWIVTLRGTALAAFTEHKDASKFAEFTRKNQEIGRPRTGCAVYLEEISLNPKLDI